MTDTVSKIKRSQIMQRIRSKDTKIETSLRKRLWEKGYKYRKHHSSLIGKPDIAFINRKIVIFIDSCFWHNCSYHCRPPHSNKRYWTTKIKRNKNRDKEVNKWYKTNKWTLIRVWEHSIQKNPEGCIRKIVKALAK